MKQIISIGFIILAFAIFVSKSYENTDLTQVVIIVSDLSDANIESHILREFLNTNGVQMCETSLATRTITIKYDERKLDSDDIRRILNKWGCHADKFSFMKLVNYINN